MAKKYPQVPQPKLSRTNTLSASGAAKDYVPRILKNAGQSLNVIGSHDYDPRGNRWGALRNSAGSRPVWVTDGAPRKRMVPRND